MLLSIHFMSCCIIIKVRKVMLKALKLDSGSYTTDGIRGRDIRISWSKLWNYDCISIATLRSLWKHIYKGPNQQKLRFVWIWLHMAHSLENVLSRFPSTVPAKQSTRNSTGKQWIEHMAVDYQLETLCAFFNARSDEDDLKSQHGVWSPGRSRNEEREM